MTAAGASHPSMPRRLPAAQFLEVVRLAPLVSLDLIVRDAEGQVLLGWRKNEPARGSWFVPGGILMKGERIAEALARIADVELGLPVESAEVDFLGVYEHHYAENFAGEPQVPTHYMVLAHQLRLREKPTPAPETQHSDFRWWPLDALLQSPEVHPYVKAYFS